MGNKDLDAIGSQNAEQIQQTGKIPGKQKQTGLQIEESLKKKSDSQVKESNPLVSNALAAIRGAINVAKSGGRYLMSFADTLSTPLKNVWPKQAPKDTQALKEERITEAKEINEAAAKPASEPTPEVKPFAWPTKPLPNVPPDIIEEKELLEDMTLKSPAEIKEFIKEIETDEDKLSLKETIKNNPGLREIFDGMKIEVARQEIKEMLEGLKESGKPEEIQLFVEGIELKDEGSVVDQDSALFKEMIKNDPELSKLFGELKAQVRVEQPPKEQEPIASEMKSAKLEAKDNIIDLDTLKNLLSGLKADGKITFNKGKYIIETPRFSIARIMSSNIGGKDAQGIVKKLLASIDEIKTEDNPNANETKKELFGIIKNNIWAMASINNDTTGSLKELDDKLTRFTNLDDFDKLSIMMKAVDENKKNTQFETKNIKGNVIKKWIEEFIYLDNKGNIQKTNEPGKLRLKNEDVQSAFDKACEILSNISDIKDLTLEQKRTFMETHNLLLEHFNNEYIHSTSELRSKAFNSALRYYKEVGG